jgi:hypothetical protein
MLDLKADARIYDATTHLRSFLVDGLVVRLASVALSKQTFAWLPNSREQDFFETYSPAMEPEDRYSLYSTLLTRTHQCFTTYFRLNAMDHTTCVSGRFFPFHLEARALRVDSAAHGFLTSLTHLMLCKN